MPSLSVSTIKDPEFINLKPLDINPLMSSCEIKVLYIGENRNYSFITKEVAIEMSKTLRGCPIVGWYKEDKEDFFDHGDIITIDGDGIKFNNMTRPYGFVSPDAKVWFKEFEDTDEFGNKIVREYLMTTGYIWDGQYKEAESIIKNGKNQSMELDEKSLDGHWAKNIKTNMEFFIVNDATFSKLCILGDEVEPCFEGANITAPNISKSFSINNSNDFKQNLYTMMQQLKFALEGGKTQMEDNKNNTDFSKNQENRANVDNPIEQNANTNFACSTDDKEKKDYKEEEEKGKKKEPDKEDKEDSEKNKDKSDEDKKDKNYSLLEDKFSKLEEKYTKLESDYNNLVAFKANVENEKKEALIAQFSMLSDEDKKDVIDHKTEYSLEEIESKLSVICFRKKINFNLNNTSDTDSADTQEEPITTFNLNNNNESVPAWISAVMNTQKSRNI